MLKPLKFIKSINFRTKSRFCFVDQVTLSRSYNIKTIIFFFGISSTMGTNNNCLLNKRNSSAILLSSSLSQSSKTPNGILISKNNENIKNITDNKQTSILHSLLHIFYKAMSSAVHPTNIPGGQYMSFVIRLVEWNLLNNKYSHICVDAPTSNL